MTSGARVSIIVPAHNRARRLPALIDALHAEIDTHGASELLLVDSASSDETADVIAVAATGNPKRTRPLRASAPGACLARNLGARAALGALLIFVDDDVLPHPGFIGSLEATHADPHVHAAGGRIILRLEDAPPPWLSAPFLSYLAGYDLGDEARDLTDGGDSICPRSAIMSVRADVFARLGGFCELFGPRGSRPMVGEEPELCRRIVQAGGRLRYAPGAVVEHLVPASRLTAEWLGRRFFYQGVTEAFADIRFAGGLAAWARLSRGITGRMRGASWDGADNAGGNPVLAECRRRQSLGYAAGVLLGSLRYRALRKRAA